jgi:FkbM family methyltransferase
MNLDEKRKKILELLERIEPKADHYVNNLNNVFFNKFLRLFILREKIIIKGFAVLMYKLLGIKIIKKAKLFYGKEFYTLLYDADASSLYFFGTLYGEEIKIIKFLIKNLNENDIFYDIGANYGFYTCLVKEFIHSGEIHSFEPLPQIFELLSKNVSNSKNVYLNQVALNDYDGQVEFYDRSLNRHSGGSSLINWHKSSNKIIVNCLKLDSYIQTHKPPTIMKIDVEGSEFLVLQGGEETLKKYQPIIIMEFMIDEYHLKAVKLLFELGYKIYSLTKDGDLNLVNNKEFDDILSGFKKVEANYIFKK